MNVRSRSSTTSSIMGALAAGLSLCLLTTGVNAATRGLPAPTSAAYCGQVQQILANTGMTGEVTVFDNMDDYRASKPAPRPLLNYQIVTYDDKRPIAVSCKVKAADHLRAEYGDDAAGEQLRCSAITRLSLDQAIRELEAEYPPEAAAKAREFIIDDTEPYVTGQSYLSSFELSYRDPEARIHIQSPGLQVNWDDWRFWIMPNLIRGQTYCHLATVPYLKALATGALQPGTVIVSTDDAITRPPNNL